MQSTPSPTATIPLRHEQPIYCAHCTEPARLTATLGVVLAVPVIRVTCEDHGIICQFPVAATAFSYHKTGGTT